MHPHISIEPVSYQFNSIKYLLESRSLLSSFIACQSFQFVCFFCQKNQSDLLSLFLRISLCQSASRSISLLVTFPVCAVTVCDKSHDVHHCHITHLIYNILWLCLYSPSLTLLSPSHFSPSSFPPACFCSLFPPSPPGPPHSAHTHLLSIRAISI